MTAPAPSGGPSPLRVGGLALLGVGAVAAVVGIGTLVTGGGDSSSTATAPSSASAPLTPAPGAATPSSPEVSVPSFGPTPTNAIAAPNPAPAAGSDGSGAAGGAGGSTGSGSGGGGGGGQTVAKSPVRVYNNSTITGLAARAAEDFRNEGWTVTAVSNYPSGNIPTSTVYFRPGTAEQAGAEAMAQQFGMRSEPRFAGLNDASPGLIVIVTNDYQKRG